MTDTVASVAARLAAAGCVAAHEEAAELVAAAPDPATVDVWTRRREAGEPLAWIVGSILFDGLRIRVDAGVYVPRLQSQKLVGRAASVLAPGGRAVDLCTGSGAVARALLARVPGARVVGTDIEGHAVRCARSNGVPTVQADLGAGLRSGWFDVVTAVAPYVPGGELPFLAADVLRYEPIHALHGGVDGLAVVRRVVGEASRLLRGGGWLVLELGGDQDGALAPTLAAFGFGAPTPWFDDDGDLRGAASRRQL